MYSAKITKERIKNLCRDKKINIDNMLVEHCSLGVNAVRQINDTKGIASFSLARIADYLDCSVDYLLGRTDNPLSHKIPLERKLSVSPSNDIELKEAAYSFKTVSAPDDDNEVITSK